MLMLSALSDEKVRELLLCAAELLEDPNIKLAKGAWGLAVFDNYNYRLPPGAKGEAYCMIGAVLRCARLQGYAVSWPAESVKNDISGFLSERIPTPNPLSLNDKPDFTKEDAIKVLRRAAAAVGDENVEVDTDAASDV